MARRSIGSRKDQSANHARRTLRTSRLSVESLEDRLAPAIFTGAGPNLTIDLNAFNEVATFSTDGITVTVNLINGTADTTGSGGNVSGNGSGTATFLSANYTGTITITDSAANTNVGFASSTGAYPQSFGITLNDAASGNVTFTGSSTFGNVFTATTASGFIASDLTSSFTQTNAGSNVAMSAAGHDILLKGAIVSAGDVIFTSNVLEADNAANDFAGVLQIGGTPIVSAVNDVNDLDLAGSAFGFSTLNQTTRITAGGNITQSGTLTSTGTGTLAFASAAGSITLGALGNSFSGNTTVSLSVTGANTASVFNSAALQLGDIRLGMGALSLTGRGSITQQPGTTIETGAAVSLTADTSGAIDLLLGNAGNRIVGAVTVAELTGGDVRDIALRNAADGALPPTGTPLSAVNDVRNLTLFFDNNGIVLPGYTINNNLAVTAGGDITQSAALTIPGTTSITVLGDFGIDLTNVANLLTGAVSSNGPQSTQPIRVTNNLPLVLGTSNLGRGIYNATAAVGGITQTGPIVQEKGAGPATFAGTSVTLTNNGNFLTGGQVFAGAGLTAVNVRNADHQAKFSDLSLPGTLTNLTVRFVNTSISLPSLSAALPLLTFLGANALGIVQDAGASLNVATAVFNSNGYAMNLSNGGNDFTDLTVSNAGRNDVTIADVDDLNFAGTSTLGNGRLTVNAGGTITDGGLIVQTGLTGLTGDVTLNSTGGSINLNGANSFRGPVSASVAGVNAITLNNTASQLVLGTITTGTGSFNATGDVAGITQDPNSVLNLGGASSFTSAGGPITLFNRINTFTGAVGLSGSSSSLRAIGAVVLSASTPGPLNIKTGGAATHSITQTGAITGNSAATFDSGAGDVILTTGANNFNSVSVFSTGNVAITDTNNLNVGTIRVGGGTLALTANSLGTAAGGSVVQTTGTGPITLDTAGGNITLNSALNVLRGTVNVVNNGNGNTLDLRSQGDLTFAPGSAINGFLFANSGGILTLPTTLTNLDGLFISAVSTTIGSDVTTSGSFQTYSGTVAFTGNRVLTSTALVAFSGDVNAGGTLAIAVPSGVVQLFNGNWNQGVNDLSITGASLEIGNSGGVPARLITSGNISLSGGGVTVLSDGTLQVGSNSAAQESVTIANGAGALTINGNLAVGFGATNDRLIKTGSGNIILGANAQLIGSGLAGTTASPVLETQTALLVGRFANSVDTSGAPRDFFAGSDIVTPAYDFTQLTVMSGGTLAPTGTATGFLPDGDKYTVKSSLGAAAGLATVEDVAGRLDVVVRNTTAAGASTLTISTTGGGDGQLPIGGVMVHAPGSVAVSAATSNFTGMFTTAGALTSLTSRDLGTATELLALGDGGPDTASTTLTSRVVTNTTVSLAGTLKSFKAISATGNNVSLTAQSFGTITTTGGVAGTNPAAPGSPNSGDFDARLTSTTAGTSTVVGSAKIVGTLSGTWDVRGNVGTVKALKTTSWTLGTLAAANIRNGGELANVSSLTLGPVTTTTMNSTGAAKTIATSEVGSSTFVAGSFGTIKVTGNTALGLVGNFNSSTLRATGNAGGIALKSLSIAGDLAASSVLSFLDGDVTSITVSRTVTGSAISATDTGTRGNLKTISAGKWQNTTVDARSVGSLKINGNPTAGLFGDFTGSIVTASGNLSGVGLGTFDAKGTVGSSNFNIQNGNLTTFKVGRQIGSTNISLIDPAFGALKTIQAGDWTSGVNVLAETIGTIASVGAKAVSPVSPLLIGGFNTDSFTAYQNTGTVAAIGNLTAKGDFVASTVNSERGIGLATFGRLVNNSTILADDTQLDAINVGRIPTLTAGAWNASSVSVNTFGTVKITGYLLPESSSASFQNGDVTTGTFLAHGATPTTPTGISTFSVARRFQTNSFLKAPFGIKTLGVGGIVIQSTIITENPASPSAGFLTNSTLGELTESTIRAGTISTLKAIGSVPFALFGNINRSVISVNSTTSTSPPQSIGTLSATGDFSDSVVDAPSRVGTISVVGRVTSLSIGARIQAGYSLFNGGIGTLTAGAWGQPGITRTTDLVTNNVGTFNLKGNTARGFAGTTDLGFIDILGSSSGVGLGTFSATGTASNSLFRVSDGDVTSFSVLRFVSSDLLVGVRMPKASHLVFAGPPDPVWSATNHRIGTFKTTAPFSAAEESQSASFEDSNVVAAILQNVTITGLNTVASNSTTFGLGFRSAGGSAGTIIIEGAIFGTGSDGQFEFQGLPG